MCGISGFYTNQLTKKNLTDMTNVLNKRGPDAMGYYYSKDNGIGLGHRRLSILDLSVEGNQPFYSKCGRYIMVYNGEVYNFKEIAKKYNIQTKTKSDTEVVLESFVLNGVACVNDFNGMFAIAIWDKKKHQLFLFRDRMGIKPLFFYNKNKDFAFASELKALKKLPLQFSINESAIASFLHLGYIPHPMSIYQECEKFPAGCYGIFKNGCLTVEKYWSIEEKIQKKILRNENEAIEQLEKLLLKSVERRMISDVPLGTFLSGGIDSSLVTALAQKQSNKPIKTFSIGFKEAKFNETKYAAAVAKHLGTEHQEIILSEQDAIERLEGLLDIYDEPFADSSAIPTLLVSEMARKEVTVSLSGDGGDELFMGYGMYDWATRLANPLYAGFRKPIRWGLSTFGDSRMKQRASVFDYPRKDQLKSHLFSQEQGFFSRKELSQILTKDLQVCIEENINENRALNAMEQQSFFDMQHYLKDDLLVKVDRASMFHSLEVRVPLIDYKVVEFALNLDSSLKIKKGVKKHLLKEVLYKYVPKQIFERPKWGFGVPLEKWLVKFPDLFLERFFNKEKFTEYGIVDYDSVSHLKKELYQNRSPHLKNKVWSLIFLHWYLDNE